MCATCTDFKVLFNEMVKCKELEQLSGYLCSPNTNFLVLIQFQIFLQVFDVVFQGEWKPKQIDNPEYKGKWVHPEIDNPEYEADDALYQYEDFGVIGFDLWQVCEKFPI